MVVNCHVKLAASGGGCRVIIGGGGCVLFGVRICVSNFTWVGNSDSGCTGTVSPQTIQTGLHSGCVLAHIRHMHNKNVLITFNNFDPFLMLDFN